MSRASAQYNERNKQCVINKYFGQFADDFGYFVGGYTSLETINIGFTVIQNISSEC